MVGPEGLLSEGNLEVGEWKDSKGKRYISITRNSGYRKTIAIPVDLVPALVDAIDNKLRELAESVA